MLRLLLAKHAQLLCFAVVGVLNTLVHGSILVMAVEFLALGVTLSHLLAFFIATVFSYFMNSRFTFAVPPSWARYARFLAASLLALAMTLFLSWMADRQGLHYLAGFALIVVLVPMFSFLLMKFWTFAASRPVA